MNLNAPAGISRPDIVQPPGYAALRRFRQSRPGADYFLTINLATRGSGLDVAPLTAEIIAHWNRLSAENLWIVRTGTVMPDHLHLLVQLGNSATLDTCVKRLKGRLSVALRTCHLKWQDGYYDRQMRQAEDLLPVFLYIYLNPYRAGLVPETKAWPGYRCSTEDWEWFRELTNESLPFPEWLR